MVISKFQSKTFFFLSLSIAGRTSNLQTNRHFSSQTATSSRRCFSSSASQCSPASGSVGNLHPTHPPPTSHGPPPSHPPSYTRC